MSLNKYNHGVLHTLTHRMDMTSTSQHRGDSDTVSMDARNAYHNEFNKDFIHVTDSKFIYIESFTCHSIKNSADYDFNNVTFSALQRHG